MIALIGLLPPAGHAQGVQQGPGLPEPPATPFSGFLVRCDQEPDLAATLAWYRDVAEQRVDVPLGIVYAPNVCLAMLGECERVIRPLLSTGELIAGAPPIAAVERLREASVEGRIMEELVAEFRESILAERKILTALIGRAVNGGTLQSAARDLKCSQEKVRLHLAKFGITPGQLMTRVRLRAYDLRKQLGVSTSYALTAGGWDNPEARRKVAGRSKNG
jgi:hypothetical protein